MIKGCLSKEIQHRIIEDAHFLTPDVQKKTKIIVKGSL